MHLFLYKGSDVKERGIIASCGNRVNRGKERARRAAARKRLQDPLDTLFGGI